MSKFYIASSQAKELYDEAKTAKEKNKELNNEVLLKNGEMIRLTDDLNRLQGIETKLKDEVEELRVDSIEKETYITHLERKKFQSSTHPWMRLVKKPLQLSKSQTSTRIIYSHYATGYEDFRADAKEAYLDLDFDSFKIPLATKSSLLLTSSEDVNVVDDATNEVTQDATVASEDDLKSRGDAPYGLSK